MTIPDAMVASATTPMTADRLGDGRVAVRGIAAPFQRGLPGLSRLDQRTCDGHVWRVVNGKYNIYYRHIGNTKPSAPLFLAHQAVPSRREALKSRVSPVR